MIVSHILRVVQRAINAVDRANQIKAERLIREHTANLDIELFKSVAK